LPFLRVLVLTDNRLTELADLDEFPAIYASGTAGESGHEEKNYRSWVIFKCRHLRFLDFTIITKADRDEAEQLFGNTDEA